MNSNNRSYAVLGIFYSTISREYDARIWLIFIFSLGLAHHDWGQNRKNHSSIVMRIEFIVLLLFKSRERIEFHLFIIHNYYINVNNLFSFILIIEACRVHSLFYARRNTHTRHITSPLCAYSRRPWICTVDPNSRRGYCNILCAVSYRSLAHRSQAERWYI